MKHILRNKGDISDIRHAYDEGAQHEQATQMRAKPVLHQNVFPEKTLQSSPATSLVSTIASRTDLLIEPSPIERRGDAIPATPQDFSALFPSNRQLLINHDHTEGDGFMNLRIDTQVGPQLMTLYHLRMQDLHNREFSLRRYCRDSGREVCHTNRSASLIRPGLQRSLSHVLSSMRPQSSGTLRRNDSGYGSMHSSDDRPRTSHGDTNIIRLDFSNYAQVDVKLSGISKYEFEYWGKDYAWRIGSDGFELHSGDRNLAYIRPTQSRSESDWIMPSIMAVTDPEVLESQKDLSDVIVAAGLVALVDYSLRSLNDISRTMKIKFVGPKRFFQILRRHSTTKSHHQPSISRAWST